MLNHLDLFSGIGGFALGLSWAGGFNTVGFCEIDPYCQKILKKHWPDVPIYEDVKDFNHEGTVDIITGGYPCQGESVAGKQRGQDDDRWLWPEMFTCIKKHRPSWVIGENVANHVNMGLNTVLTDLESEGYQAEVFIIPACALNAPHRRDRVWVVAHAQSQRPRGRADCDKEKGPRSSQNAQPDSCGANVSNCNKQRAQIQTVGGFASKQMLERFSAWEIEPAVGRVANGIPRRMDRIRALGNAVVPQIPYVLGCAILEVENDY